MLRPLIVICFVVFVISCKKSDSDGIKPEDKEKAAKLETLLQSGKFRLTAYYSDNFIDYIDTDQVVKQEKDLWQYVSAWLHDDRYVFDGKGNVTVEQNTIKIPTDNSATLNRQYAVRADKDGVAFDFIGHEYQVLKYRMVTFNDTLLTVSATWNGKTVKSEYKKGP